VALLEHPHCDALFRLVVRAWGTPADVVAAVGEDRRGVVAFLRNLPAAGTRPTAPPRPRATRSGHICAGTIYSHICAGTIYSHICAGTIYSHICAGTRRR
jgi:hypothetical protein